MDQGKRSYILLFLLSFVLRFAYFLMIAPWEQKVQNEWILRSDALEYHSLANCIVQDHRFAIHTEEKVTGLRSPGYPLFLASFYSIFGSKPWIPIFVQLIIDSLSCLLLLNLAERISTPRIGLVAAVFFAIDPFLVFHSAALLSETIFIFLLLVAASLAFKAISGRPHPPSQILIVFAGIAFGLSTITKPVSIYMLCLLPFALLFLLRRNSVWVLKLLCLFTAGALMCIFPWLARNFIAFDTAGFSTSGDHNLLTLWVSPMEAARTGEDIDEVRKRFKNEVDSVITSRGLDPSKLNDFERERYARTLAVERIEERPIAFAGSFFAGVSHSFANLNTSGFAESLHMHFSGKKIDIKRGTGIIDLLQMFLLKTKDERIIAIAISIFLLLEYTFLSVGLFVAWENLNRVPLLISLGIACYFILISGPFGLARFRLPAIPFYLVFVGVGAEYLCLRLIRATNLPGQSK